MTPYILAADVGKEFNVTWYRHHPWSLCAPSSSCAIAFAVYCNTRNRSSFVRWRSLCCLSPSRFPFPSRHGYHPYGSKDIGISDPECAAKYVSYEWFSQALTGGLPVLQPATSKTSKAAWGLWRIAPLLQPAGWALLGEPDKYDPHFLMECHACAALMFYGPVSLLPPPHTLACVHSPPRYTTCSRCDVRTYVCVYNACRYVGTSSARVTSVDSSTAGELKVTVAGVAGEVVTVCATQAFLKLHCHTVSITTDHGIVTFKTAL